MRYQPLKFLMLFIIIGHSNVWAKAAAHKTNHLASIHPVLSVSGGYASMLAGHSQTYQGTDTDIFSYNANKQANAGFLGGFIGSELPLWHAPWSLLIGVEYLYYWPTTVRGENTVGIESDSQTAYAYQYNFQTQQLLGSGVLIWKKHPRFQPYVSVGLGGAWNKQSAYSASTSETGSINLTPVFNGNTQTEFSYSLGAGILVNLTHQWRAGVGYRYNYFGLTQLGSGQININNTTSIPVAFTLRNANAYANSLFVQLHYLFDGVN